MEQRELSLVGKLDIGLTKGLCIMLVWLKKLGLWLLGLIIMSASFWIIFEYDEGLADISWHEWGFLLLLPLMLWRHVRYCQHFSIGFWRGLSRLLIAQGVLGVLLISSYGLFVGLLLENEDHASALLYLTQENPVDKLVEYGLILLAVYLAAPVSTASLSTRPTESTRMEPSVLSTAQEVSQ